MQRVVLAALLLAVSSVSSAWWNEAWTGRKAFVLDTGATGANVSGVLADVPVLLRLHSGNFPAFFEVADGGRDFRFFAEDEATPLKYHIESFDPINELAFVWVKVPTLAPNNATQKIWMYYGNTTAPAAADLPGTFDVAQTLVVHFDSDLGQPVDATAYANNPSAFTGETIPASLAGAGGRLDGTSQLAFAASPSLRVDSQSGMTFSVWLKPGTNDGERQIMRIGNESGGIALRLVDGNLQALHRASDGMEAAIDAGALSATGWQQVVLVAEASRLSVYNNGRLVGQSAVALAPIDAPLVIGAEEERPGYVGDLDEVRFANTARSAQWVNAAYIIQGSDKLVFAEVDEGRDAGAGDGGATSFFGTILSNVSIDGWLVIGLLGIMSALSWVVMIMKTMSLNRIASDNQAFMQQFKRLDPSEQDALDQAVDDDEEELDTSPVLQALFGRHDHFQSSNIYHVYHIAMTELKKRIGTTVGAQSILSSRGLIAIRTAMDAATVRETQKLNSLMVMLTIAIAGGPFLGLLGTVMGVMITFAAIAITGDVNIDAIAPGVSAALMTTVAGLLVAIPALFGYNYLAIRIRDMTADMYVFVDELEAKIGENHA